jgi:hypothetical protein
MTLPDRDHRVIVLLGPSFELQPGFDLLDGEIVAKERQGEGSGRHLSTQTEDFDIVDQDPKDGDGQYADDGELEDIKSGNLGRRHVLPMGVEGLEDTHCACTSHRTERSQRVVKHLTKDSF